MYEHYHVARSKCLIQLLEQKRNSVPDDLRYPRVIRKLETILLLIEMVENRSTLDEQGYLGGAYHRADRNFLIQNLWTTMNEARDLLWSKRRTNLSTLEISNRILNALQTNGFESWEELKAAKPEEIYMPKKLGRGLFIQLADGVRKSKGQHPASWLAELRRI